MSSAAARERQVAAARLFFWINHGAKDRVGFRQERFVLRIFHQFAMS